MYCLLNDDITWEDYVHAGLHFSAITAIIYGIIQLIKEGRREPAKSA